MRKEIEFAEEVETCPADPSSPTPPSYSTTAKRSTKGKERKKKNAPVQKRPSKTQQQPEPVEVKREPGTVVTVQSAEADEVDKETAPPEMAEFEMDIGTRPEHFRALQVRYHKNMFDLLTNSKLLF